MARLTSFNTFESLQGFHLTLVNALAKISKQRTEKKESAQWHVVLQMARPTSGQCRIVT